MFVTTDENGRLEMLPLQRQAKQHDDDVDSSANANPQPPQAQFSLPQAADPAGEAGGASSDRSTL